MFFILFLNLFSPVYGWDCGANEHPALGHEQQKPQGRRLNTRSGTVDYFRLKIVFADDFNLGSADALFRNEVIDSMKEFLGKTLRVNQRVESIVPQRDNCYGYATYNAEMLAGGSDIDYLLYIGSVNDASESFAAYALACEYDSNPEGNPIIGLNMVNAYYASSYEFEVLLSLILHEITHALGFSSNNFSDFIDPSTGSRYEEYQITKTVRGMSTSKYFLTYPILLAEARNHFDCSTLDGVELEEFGGSGTAGSHWDERIAFNDYMIGHVLSVAIYSRLTFALLESSGWYEVDYTYVQENMYGFKEGCGFLEEPCLVNGQTQFREFCDNNDSAYCDYHHTGLGYCDIRDDYSSDLPAEFQYFPGEPKKGGGSVYPDYCPLVDTYSNYDCRTAPDSFYEVSGETIGINSRCLESTLIQTQGYNPRGSYRPVCYEVECGDNEVSIRVGNSVTGYSSIPCPAPGTLISWPGVYHGDAVCPGYDLLCTNVPCLDNCYLYGVCTKGICVCDEGRGGDNCSIICDDSCYNCSGTSSSECTSCKTGFTLQNGSCVDACASDCQTCDPNNLNFCLGCVDPLKAPNAAGQCECNEGYFSGANGCQSCNDFGCSTCNSATDCSGCIDNHYLEGSQCFPCSDIGCETCEEDKTCSECIAGHYLSSQSCPLCTSLPGCTDQCDSETGACTTCEAGSYPVDGACELCTDQPGCGQDCNTSTGECISCSNEYFPNNGACTECSTFPGCLSECDSSGNCGNCDSGYTKVNNVCILCDISNCLACDANGACVDCAATTYLTQGTCEDCTSLAGCTDQCDSETGACTTCETGSYPLNGVCTDCTTQSGCGQDCDTSTGDCSSCSNDFFLDNGDCRPCSELDGCLSGCNPDGTCENCDSGYTKVNNVCILCDISNCLACDANGACVDCATTTYLTQGTCEDCTSIAGCTDQCNSETGACTTCEPGSYPVDGVCTDCNSQPGCGEDCDASTGDCSSCSNEYFLDNGACTECSTITGCLSNCDSSGNCGNCGEEFTEINGVCIPCNISNCLACDINGDCAECATTTYLTQGTCEDCTSLAGCTDQCNSETGACTTCETGSYPLNGVCTDCTTQSGCGEDCNTSTGECISCSNEYFPDNGACTECSTFPGCLSDCDSSGNCGTCGEEFTEINGACIPCDVTNCLACDINEVCISCASTTYLTEGFTCEDCTSIAGCTDQCDSATGACTTCEAGSYPLNGVCELCTDQPGCNSDCDPSTGACNSCTSTHILEADGTCTLCSEINSRCESDCTLEGSCGACQSQYFTLEGACLECTEIPGCSSCSNIVDGCGVCESGLNPVDGLCPEACDDLCVNCDNSTGECDVCVLNATPNALGVCECDFGYELSGTECIRCTNYFSATEVTATLANGNTIVYVTFQSNVFDTSITDCSVLILSGNIGTDPVCEWIGSNQLRITLGSGATLENQTLTLNNDVITKENLGCDSDQVDLDIAIQGNLPTPSVTVVGPAVYYLPCSDSELEISGEQSTWSSPDTPTYSWTATFNGNVFTLLSDYIDEDELTIPDSDLSVGTYVFTLTITNQFGNSDSDSATVEVSDDIGLIVVIEEGSDQTINVSDNYEFTVSVDSNCGVVVDPVFTWEYLGGGGTIDLAEVLPGNTNKFFVDAGDFEAGFTYSFRVTVTVGSAPGDAIVEETISGTADLNLTVVGSGISAIITRVDGEASTQVDLILDGTKSYYLSTGNPVSEYSWECEESGNVCLGSDGDPLIQDGSLGILTIDAARLVPGQTLIFTLTASLGAISDSESVTLDTVDVPVSSIEFVEPEYIWSVNWDMYFYNSFYYAAQGTFDMAWYQLEGSDLSPWVPSIDNFLYIPGSALTAGEQYTVEAKYTGESQDYDFLYPWYVNTPPACGSITADFKRCKRGSGIFKLKLHSCQDLEEDQIRYSFGYIYNGEYYSLVSGKSKSHQNIRLSGTWTLAALAYDIYDDSEMYTIEVTSTCGRMMLEEHEIEEQFMEDVVNPDSIPMAVFYYAEEEELTLYLWELMFTHLESYMVNLRHIDQFAASSIMSALTALMKEEVAEKEQIIECLTFLSTMIVDKKAAVSSTIIKTFMSALDEAFPQFSTETEIITLAKDNLFAMLVTFMDGRTPGLDPIEFESESFLIRKERMQADKANSMSIQHKDVTLSLPSTLPFESSDVIDVTLMVVLRKESDLVDITFSESGSLEGTVLTLTPETVKPLTDLTHPITLTIPVDSSDTDYKCVYLNNGVWDPSGCKVIDVWGDSCKIETTHTSMFTVKGSGECQQNYLPMSILSGVLVLLVAALVINKCRFNKYLKRQRVPGSSGDNELEDLGQPKEIDNVENTEPFMKRLQSNHLLFSQICKNSFRAKAVCLLFLSIICDLTFAGVLLDSLEENGISEVYDFIMYSLFTVLLTLTTIGILDALISFTSSILSSVFMAITYLATIGGTIFITFSSCGEFATEWIIVFVIATIFNLLVSQTFIAALKTSIRSN